MKSKSIEECAEKLAKEISERSIFDIEDVKGLIVLYFNESLAEFIKEHTSQSEKEYYLLLQQQSKNKIGSREYVSLGYKLAAAKYKKTASNRVLNEVRLEDKYTLLTKFVVEQYGQEVIDKFIDKAVKENLFPISSSTF